MVPGPMDDADHSEETTPDPDETPGALGRLRHLARRSRHRLGDAVRRRIDAFGDSLRDEFIDFLSSPRRVEKLQRLLANIAGWTLQRGFRNDPNARLLFEFVDWLEERHGRQTVSVIIIRSPLLRDPEFLDALAYLSAELTPWSPEVGGKWDQRRIERFKRRAGQRLTDLLVELASLEAEQPPPENAPERKLEYFRQAPIPDRFHRLAAMTRGDQLAERRRPLPSDWAAKLADSFGSSKPGETDLAPWIPGRGDKTLHFLVFSTTLFVQSYLVRNLIESLPAMADRLQRRLRDDLVDID